MPGRMMRVLAAPVKMLFAKAFPEQYARIIGVNMKGLVRIYGSAYSCFGTEPWIITLGNNVHITNNVRFITHDGATLIFRKIRPDLEITKPISVGDDVYIGVNAIIMPGVSIGNKCIIGAGAVVTGDVPENSVAVGVPARVIKSADAYFEKALQSSLQLGILTGKRKDRALRRYYHHR
jgi:acetyltransferase-like isoleucine patch superfamily enzyme